MAISPFGLMDFIGNATYQPQITPNLTVDPNTGQFYDNNNNKVSPYITPSWFSRATSPLAREAEQFNAQSQLAPALAQQQRGIQRGVGLANWNTLTPQQQALFGGNAQNAITTTGGDFTGQNLQGQGAALAGINAGNPNMQAIAAHNLFAAQAQEQANAAKEAATSGLLGLPETRPVTEEMGQEYQQGELGGETALQPGKFYNEGLQQRLGQEQLQTGLTAQPARSEAEINRALYEAGLSEADIQSLPLDQKTRFFNAIKGNVASQYAPEMAGLITSPVTGQISDSGATVGMNPNYSPMALMQMAGFQRAMAGGGMLGQGQPITLPSGIKGYAPSRQPGVTIPALSARPPISSVNALEGLRKEQEDAKKNQNPTKPTPPQVTRPARAVSLGTSLGGLQANAAPTINYPAPTKEQALAQIGMYVDKNGQLQQGYDPSVDSGLSGVNAIQGTNPYPNARDIELAKRILSSPSIKWAREQ